MKRCLFVDNSSVVRQVARRILASDELVVMEAASGAHALDICSMEMPDYILVEAGLPDMPIETFIRNVRATRASVVPRIAICLIEVDVATIMRSKRAGANGYLLKPFNRAQLTSKFHALQAA